MTAATVPPFRATLFQHQDGFVTSVVIGALQQENVLDSIALEPRTVGEIIASTGAISGYLHVALRCLAAQGWLTRSGAPGTDECAYAFTDLGTAAMPMFPSYQRSAAFLRDHYRPPIETFLITEPRPAALRTFSALVEEAVAGWTRSAWQEGEAPSKELRERFEVQLDGSVAVPLILALRALGTVDRFTPRDGPAFAEALRFLEHLGWYDPIARDWTALGHTAGQYSLHYGMVGSYIPMLVKLPQLMFGTEETGVQRTHVSVGEQESHVDRLLNVRASAAAHPSYFAAADDIFRDMFDREPIQDQPSFVADMGCGDGTWLAHIYGFIRENTKRGKVLDEHPLLMIGLDYNETALDVTRATLKEALVPSLVFFGDVTDPDLLAQELSDRGIDITRGLHIRSFIDHNRRYQPPTESQRRTWDRRSLSTGAYIDQEGNAIPNQLLEQDLINFLRKWVPHVKKHGMVILEGHCVDPIVASRQVGVTHNICFDTYHGLSQQYPVDFEVFMRAADVAGLESIIYHQRRYPAKTPFVAISLNRFVTKAEDSQPLPLAAPGSRSREPGEWRPNGTENLSDGDALHRLLFERGDIRSPRTWCSNSTGLLLEHVLEALSKCIERIRDGVAPPTLTVMDYGTGTGMALIELLKACKEVGILGQIDELKIDFVIHALDLPRGWFAKGYELLKGCPYVRFYSLTDEHGAFRPLTDVIPARSVDIAILCWVFHLIPAPAYARACGWLADVMADEGRLIWNAPDIGPPLPNSVLFHEANRRLRKRLLEVLEKPALLKQAISRPGVPMGSTWRPPPVIEGESTNGDSLVAAVAKIAAELSPDARATIARDAEQQVLATPNQTEAVARALDPFFEGTTFGRTFEMRLRDAIDLALVPSNQRIVREISDPELRRELIVLLLNHDVLPAIAEGPARTGFGFNVSWVFGDYKRRKR